MTRVSYDFPYDINLVFNTITDADFLQQRATTLGSVEASCEVQGDRPNSEVMLTRKRKLNIPRVLKPFIKTVQTAVSNERWEQQGQAYVADNATKVSPLPLSINGQMILSPSPGGCTVTATFTSKVKIFIGKKTLQRYTDRTIAKEIELECEYTDRYLSGVSS